MSMASMLGKMVVAGLVAKGVGKMMGGSSSGGGGGLGGALAGMLGGSGGGGGVGGMLGGLLGGNQGAQEQGGAGGLGGLLSSLGGNASQQQGGGIGDILGSLMGGDQQAQQVQPTAEQDQQAEVLIRAMLNAAKADGEIDQSEQQRILKHLGDISEDEAQFLRTEMSTPTSVDTFIRSVPRGMEQQVYLMSLTAIDLDSKSEAQYLHKLAQGLGISEQACNHIHQQVGAPQLYS